MTLAGSSYGRLQWGLSCRIAPIGRNALVSLALALAGCGSSAAAPSAAVSPEGGGMNPPDGPPDRPPPKKIGACDGLGAPGVWQDASPAQVNLGNTNGIVEVLVDPVNAGTVYVGTDKNGILKSTDCGSTWTKTNTGRNGDVLDTGIQWSMALDPIDPQVLYAGNLYGSDTSLFKSTNGGVDWDSLWPAGSNVMQNTEYNAIQELSMDPTNHKHIVVTFHANCKGAYAPMCMGETTDSGATWRLFKGPTNAWGEDARPIVIGPKTFLYVTLMDGLFYTADSGATWERVGDAGHHQMYHAKDGSYYLGSVYGVLKSPDGHKWTKIEGSPNGDGITGDGAHVFNSLRDPQDQKPYFAATESDGTDWTAFPSPAMAHGGVYLAYDSDHHLLYSANTSSGLWRVVTDPTPTAPPATAHDQ